MTALARIQDVIDVCDEAAHDALKLDTYRIARECTFIGEQRDAELPTLLLYNHCCGSTVSVKAAR
jgi:hypothetical protein